MNNPEHPHHISPWKVILVLLILAGIVVTVGLLGYIPRQKQQEAAQAAAKEERESLPRVNSAKAKRAPADVDIVLPGNIAPLAEASIYARASGYVRKRYVDLGDRVKAGQLLAEIEVPELDQQVAQARAALSQAKQQLAMTKASLLQAESQRDLAKVTSERYTGLVSKGAVSRQDADVQVATFKTADALVAAQQSSVGAVEESIRQAQANLDRVLALQEFKSVRAPIAGVITARNIEVGSLISAAGGGVGAAPNPAPGATGGASGNELYRVAQVSTVRILESVPQSTAVAIHPGMPAEVTVNEFPTRKFAGKVVRSSNALDPNSRTMLVEVHLTNADGKLLPGMYSEVKFRSHREVPPVVIPGDAIIATSQGSRVAVLIDSPGSAPGARKIHLVPVVIGRDYGAQTEIVSGLAGTETVVVNPGDEVREGAVVLIDTQKGAGKE